MRADGPRKAPRSWLSRPPASGRRERFGESASAVPCPPALSLQTIEEGLRFLRRPGRDVATLSQILLGPRHSGLHFGVVEPELIPGHQLRGHELERSPRGLLKEDQVSGSNAELR